jgi:hypothetical protein
MNAAQALAIAAASWVVAVDMPMTATFQEARVGAQALAARLETVADVQLSRIEGGFRATPDGLCIERKAALR